MALQILLAHPDATDPYRTSARVLVCAPSNGAADVILERLANVLVFAPSNGAANVILEQLAKYGRLTCFREQTGYGRLASFREQMGWAGDGSLDESGNDDGEESSLLL
ncbi:hypothetical protein T492DRAFT_845194 [Pavlovales sp. CCMP2436]|nr:hypothetical protein T492DRAFT_845194 [Pavlovales sp. CCMP2436]